MQKLRVAGCRRSVIAKNCLSDGNRQSVTIVWVFGNVVTNAVAGLFVLTLQTQLFPELIRFGRACRQQLFIMPRSIVLGVAVVKFDCIYERGAARM